MEELEMLQNFLESRETEVDEELQNLQIALGETLYAKQENERIREEKEKKIIELVGKLAGKIRRLPTGSTVRINGLPVGSSVRKIVQTPTGKILAIRIDRYDREGHVGSIYMNWDNHFHTMGGKDAILPLHLSNIPGDIKEYQGRHGSRAGYLKDKDYPEKQRRALLCDNYVDYEFAGNGFTGHEEEGYKAIYKAFGFKEDTSAHDKLITILETLNNQL